MMKYGRLPINDFYMKSKRIFLFFALYSAFFSCNDDSGTIGFSVDDFALYLYRLVVLYTYSIAIRCLLLVSILPC